MSILDLNLNNVTDQTLAEPGEHQFRIASADVKENANGKQYIAVGMESLTQPDSDWVFENLYLPREDQEKRGQDFLLRRIKACCEAFDVPLDKKGALDVEAMLGCQGYATVKHREDDNGNIRAEIGAYSTGK